MSAIEENNSKDNLNKIIYNLNFSPYTNKKNNLGIIYTEPRNVLKEKDSNLSKNQIKQKINSNINKNIINIQQQDGFRKNVKLFSEINDKSNANKKNNNSHRKSNSKYYLKKNVNSNIPLITDMNSNVLSTQSNTNSNTNINNISNDIKNKMIKDRLTNIKFNIGKSSQNFLNIKKSTSNLKKNAGSAMDLLDNNNYFRKTKSKVSLNEINYIYTSGNNQKSFLSPQNNISNPKIIFSKNDKSKNFNPNTSKELKSNQNQKNENNNKDIEDKKDEVNCLMRNTFTNVKIYPTTILNNKIIYNQVEKNNNQSKNSNQYKNNNKSNISNLNNSSMHYNNSKIKKEKIIIETVDKKPDNNNNNKKENFQSIEELHYFYVDTLQRGRIYAIKLDK